MATSLASRLASVFSLDKLPILLVLCIFHVVIGSIVYDLVHWLAHKSPRSRYRILRLLSKAHAVHHQYFNRNLKFNDKYRIQNALLHLPLELLCQMIGSTCSWLCVRTILTKHIHVLRRTEHDLAVTFTFQICRTLFVELNEGHDSNHISYGEMPKDPHFFVVGPQYHALHHIEPQRYYGSMVRLVDWALGTASSLQGRSVAITGSRGSFGQAIITELTMERVKCIKPLRFGIEWSHGKYTELESILTETDILILAHGSKNAANDMQANCKSAVDLIELFKASRKRSKPGVMPEVWYVGSEAELHGAWTKDMQSYTESKRVFAQYGRAYYDDKTIVYRHIVPAAFESSMGSALVSASWAARVALWWIYRGARYVPASYTGLAFVNYLRFIYWVKPVSVAYSHCSDDDRLRT